MTVPEKERLRAAEQSVDRLTAEKNALHAELELERRRVKELHAAYATAQDLIAHYQRTAAA